MYSLSLLNPKTTSCLLSQQNIQPPPPTQTSDKKASPVISTLFICKSTPLMPWNFITSTDKHKRSGVVAPR